MMYGNLVKSMHSKLCELAAYGCNAHMQIPSYFGDYSFESPEDFFFEWTRRKLEFERERDKKLTKIHMLSKHCSVNPGL